MIFKGAYTAIITPFKEDETIDYSAFYTLIQRQIDAKIDGIVVLGTTGESPTIDDNERNDLIREVVNLTRGKTTLIIGCGTNCTKKTIAQVQTAEKLGADAVMVVAPYYNRPTQQGIIEHFRHVAHAITLPLCIYNIPSRTGQNIEPDTIIQLADIPNISSVKEASGNISQIADLIGKMNIARPECSILSGDDALTLPVMALGGKGIISVISNLLPKTVKSLSDAMLQGNIAKAQQLHYALKPLVQAAFIETNPGPIKIMLKQVGLASSTMRLPLVPVSEMHSKKLENILRKHELLLAEELTPCAQ